jgi:hypothetical protein
MRRRNFLIVICIAALFLFVQGQAIAQQDLAQYSFGLKFGYADDPWNTHIGWHAAFAGFVEHSVTTKTSLIVEAEYFQKITNGVWSSLEHRGTLYTAMIPYIWQSFAVGVGMKYSVLDWLRMGGGISGDMIITRRAAYADTSQFVIDYPNENVSFVGESNHTTVFLRPSAYLVFDVHHRFSEQVSSFFEGRFSATFLGPGVPDNNYLITGIYGISIGLVYRIK